MKTPTFNRRSLLRGALGGGAFVVGLPLLDQFLDGNGTALADGAPIPTRFATFFWGLGLTPTRWEPQTVGRDYVTPPQLSFLEGDLKKKATVFTGFTVNLNGRKSHPHWTGMAAIMTGQCPNLVNKFDGLPTFDTAISEALGKGTRYRSIECTPFRSAVISYSSRGQDSMATSDDSPVALYNRLFGAGFVDPNAPGWQPDARTVIRKSVLSTVKDQRDVLMAEAGASDRARLDQYFTSIREVEQKLNAELSPPARAEACLVPARPEDRPRKGDTETVAYNNAIMSQLTAMALACNQTRVVNYQFTPATSEMYRPGDTTVYHSKTHQEPVDGRLGYQPVSSELADVSINGFATFVKALDAIKEGDGTLLDHALALGYSDTGWAKIHSIDNIPVILVGGASGRHKGGSHFKVAAEPVTRISLTVQQMMGLPVGSFGLQNMVTGKPISEIMA
jgi:hypothetical protein